MRNRLIAIVLTACGAATAAGDIIPVANHSFEAPELPPGDFTLQDVPGWTASSNGFSFGVFYPTVESWGYAASDGHNLLYTDSRTPDGTDYVEQTTNAALTFGGTYTLAIDVIRRPFYGTDTYLIQLLAGSTVIAEDTSTLVIPVGEFRTSVIFYTPDANDPLLGQALTIRLSGVHQTNFDNVRFDGPVPSPSALAPLCLLAFAGRRRRVA